LLLAIWSATARLTPEASLPSISNKSE
jgi:hypothetical protein